MQMTAVDHADCVRSPAPICIPLGLVVICIDNKVIFPYTLFTYPNHSRKSVSPISPQFIMMSFTVLSTSRTAIFCTFPYSMFCSTRPFSHCVRHLSNRLRDHFWMREPRSQFDYRWWYTTIYSDGLLIIHNSHPSPGGAVDCVLEIVVDDEINLPNTADAYTRIIRMLPQLKMVIGTNPPTTSTHIYRPGDPNTYPLNDPIGCGHDNRSTTRDHFFEPKITV